MAEARAAERDAPPSRARHLLARLEAGDCALLLYVAAVARICFWGVGSNLLAWALTAIVSAAVVYFYVSTRERRGASPPQFWLVLALPLLAAYLARLAFPDTSFDVMNYRLFHAERALAGPLFAAGDWFPTPSPFGPAPDIATGICRRLLGYRLGTALNLLAVVWAAQVVERLLRPYVRDHWRRAVCVLLVALSEHVLFEINEYMIDVLAVPLVLEAVYLATRESGERGAGADAVRAAFLLGLASAFKLTSLTLALPLAITFTPRLLPDLRAAPRRTLAALALACAAFLLPLLPYAEYLYRETGNPVFPVYNAVFRSPYWTAANYRDPRWGPFGLAETITWPLASVARAARLSELAVYSGRFTLGTLGALAGLVLARRDRLVRALCVVFLLDALAWSASTGYIRYALHLEFVAGALLVCLASRLARGAAPGGGSGPRRAVAALALAALVAQGLLAVWYTKKTEWSGRPTVVDLPRAYFREARLLLRDHSLADFLPERERALFAQVEVWIVSGIKANGIQVMLRPDAPAIGVRQGEYFAGEESRASFEETVGRAAGRRMYSLCLNEDLAEARKFIEARGLRVAGVTPVSIPYYSTENVLPMTLIEVAREPGPGGGGEPKP